LSAQGSQQAYIPNRGHLIRLNLSPRRGHEQDGHRPAIVLSPESYNSRSGLMVICPITNQQKGYPFEVPIPDGCTVTGAVLADQVRCVAWGERFAAYTCDAPDELIDNVTAKIAALICL